MQSFLGIHITSRMNRVRRYCRNLRISEFMSWDGGTLTDSGGFQMVSLLDLADISMRIRFS